VLLLAALFSILGLASASAVEPIKISRDDVALDLSRAVEIYRNQGDTFQVSTAPGADGIVRRIEVAADSERSTGDWAVFALANRISVMVYGRIVATGTPEEIRESAEVRQAYLGDEELA
jgi:hypothetical protein